jgi:hypothetical protein
MRCGLNSIQEEGKHDYRISRPGRAVARSGAHLASRTTLQIARQASVRREAPFRGYSAILESAEADLIRNVGLDMARARAKLDRIRKSLQVARGWRRGCMERRRRRSHRKHTRVRWRRLLGG